MIKKQLYTIETTLKTNLSINYNRFLFGNQRRIAMFNKERYDNLTYSYLQTENFDKYYDTKFIGLTMYKNFSDTIFGTDDDELEDNELDDDDF